MTKTRQIDCAYLIDNDGMRRGQTIEIADGVIAALRDNPSAPAARLLGMPVLVNAHDHGRPVLGFRRHVPGLALFGFQSERRTFWEAPDVYTKMSPFWLVSAGMARVRIDSSPFGRGVSGKEAGASVIVKVPRLSGSALWI